MATLKYDYRIRNAVKLGQWLSSLVAGKVGGEAHRERERQRVLEQLAHGLAARKANGTAPDA